MIAKILSAKITHYRDNGQTVAYIDWTDTRGRKGTTVGSPTNMHMKALLARAAREGIAVTRT